jgi:hypothetical protein
MSCLSTIVRSAQYTQVHNESIHPIEDQTESAKLLSRGTNRFLSHQYRTVKHSSYLANSFDQITLGTDRSLASQRTSQREVTSHGDRVKGNFHREDVDQKSKRKRKRKPCDVSPCPSPRRMSADHRFLHRITRPSACRRRENEILLRVVMMMMLEGDVLVVKVVVVCDVFVQKGIRKGIAARFVLLGRRTLAR